MVPDVMHDILEGALEYETKLLLRVLIHKGYFTLDQFNSRLENIDLGYMEIKNRPTLIVETTLYGSSNKLKQEGKYVYCS